MAKLPKKHGATKNTPLSPLEIAFKHYEAGDMVAARTKAKALAAQTPEEPCTEPALVAKLWPTPLPSPLPSQQTVAQALVARTQPPLSAYAYALACVAVAVLLGLVTFFRN
jgi:hypothetical protein